MRKARHDNCRAYVRQMIEAGSLTPRYAIAGILRPDTELARFVHAECSRGDWAGYTFCVGPHQD